MALLTLQRPAAALLRRRPVAQRRRASAAPGLLAQLPDYHTGVAALEAGKPSDALAPLERAAQVAQAYFPAAAAQERALCQSALGRCHWLRGKAVEAAAAYEAGLAACRGQAPPAVPGCLAASAARMRFELGDLATAGTLAAEAVAAEPGSETAVLMLEAVRAAEGGPGGDDAEPASPAAQTLRRSARLLSAALPDGGAPSVAPLEEELAEGRPLALLLADAGPTSLPLLAARSSLGQLAVAAGQWGQPWARPLLVRALTDYEALAPAGSPTYSPLLFQTLGAMGSLLHHLAVGNAIEAEGLYIAAIDHMEKALQGGLAPVVAGPRGRVWQAKVFLGFAEMLEQGRRAEQRRSEIEALRGKAATALGLEGSAAPQLSHAQLRWALAPAPAPEPLVAEG